MEGTLNSVMVVDDNRLDRFIVEKLIEKAQFAASTVPMEMGRDALNYISERINNNEPLPQVIFLDINMPGMDGFEFLEEFNNFSDEVKNSCSIVMLSSSLNEDDHKRAMSFSSVKMYCNKPLNVDKLEELKKNMAS